MPMQKNSPSSMFYIGEENFWIILSLMRACGKIGENIKEERECN